jgi:hypothetical protein
VERRQQRLAANESLFRSVNERIEELAEGPFQGSPEAGARAWDFVCECADPTCSERVALTIAEYEQIRAVGNRFVVAPAPEHVDTTIENVVDMNSRRYWVVEKTDEAAKAANRDDPRQNRRR